MKSRLGRAALSLVLMTGVVGGVGSAALADDAGSCVVNYQTVGRSVVVGFGLEIPYPNLAGGPFVETELNAIPKSYALASNAHEGSLGEIVLGNSGGAYPENPTQAKSYYPVPEGEQASIKREQGPFAATSAETGPGVAKASAAAFGGGSEALGLGPSLATAISRFTGKVLSGHDESLGYNLHLGGARIDMLRARVDYSTDGTEAGTVGTWKLEFFGIHNADQSPGTFTGDGLVVQGGAPQPGASGRQQFNAGVAQLSDALEKAGAGRVEVAVDPGAVKLSAGTVQITGAGFTVRGQPALTEGSSAHAASLTFGHIDRTARIELGSCEGSVESSGSGA
jgi:hypothetical protein